MQLRRLRVKHLRNHHEFLAQFNTHATLVYGKNGTGKTSLLEAIYIAYRGVSFRGTDKDILQEASQWYRIDITDDTDEARTIVYDNRGERSRKEFMVGGKKTARLPQRQKKPIVLFTPDDLRLIDGSPARRRQYLDIVIMQIDPQYGMILRRYERALQQRNKLLKSTYFSDEQFFSWNVILSEAGSYIINARHDFVARLDERINHHYHSIAHSQDSISMSYTHMPTTAAKLLTQYDQSFERDKVVGNTSIGPHRHDIEIRLRNNLAADIASRGEMRTIVVAMKYIEAELLHELFDEYPVVLLDDVYGELDLERRRNLIQTLKEYQVIITSTDKITALPRGTGYTELL